MLVDDAIVVIENVYRHRENGATPYEAALNGTTEIIWPVISSILTTIAAFLPLLTISGVMGKFLKEMPIIVAFTLLASLLEAITVLPVHLYEMKKLNNKKNKKNKWWLFIVDFYKKILFWSLKLRYLTIIIAFSVLIYSIYLAKNLSIVMFPSDSTDKLNAKLELPEGTGIKETTEYLKQIEAFILKKYHPRYIKSIVSIAGRVIEDNRWVVREYVAELRMELTTEDKKIQEEIKNSIRKKANSIPKIVNFEFFQNANGPPKGRPIDVSITGEELDKLVKIGERIITFLKKTDGVVDLRSSIIEKNNQIEVIPDLKLLNKSNLSLSKVASVIRGFIAGKYAGKFQDKDGKELNIWVRLNRKKQYSLDDIRNLPIRTPKGRIIRIGDLVKLKEVQKLAKIKRRNGIREVRIKANIDSLKTTSNKVNISLSKKLRPALIKDYPEYDITLKGEAEDQKHAIHDVLIAFFMALVLIYAILGIQFNSFLQPMIILTAIPFSLIGVSVGLHLSSLPLSFMAMISLVALIGIVVNDSIILVDLINRMLKNKEKQPTFDKKDILVEAGAIRLRPIILTTITTIGGLIPMAFFASGASKTWQPMAVTIIWGIGFATFLTLFLIPVIFKILDDIKFFFILIISKFKQNGKNNV
jgi:multidrug efflux pump subunit AcrB